jgi:NAD(P)H-dependent FMN reductase
VHKIVAISGSTRKNSTNLNLIKAIESLSQNYFHVILFNNLINLPQFNPDETDTPPAFVMEFKKLIADSDGVLICTPEYAMGVPGSLKNAIDWTVGSVEFSHKPTALITASSQGFKGHASLLETLKVIEAKITDETQLLISFAKTKVSKENTITDNKTLIEVNSLLNAFRMLIEQSL